MLGERKIIAVLPAYNEAPSVGKVVAELAALTKQSTPIFDQIIVCDNNSSDATADIACRAGATVVFEPIAGYGGACLAALAHLHKTTIPLTKKDIIVFIDADYAFYTSEALRLIQVVINGADLVIGSRVSGHCLPGALTLPQRIGNFLACRLIRWRWGHFYTDLGPFRAIHCEALEALNMSDKTFGWTIEMQIKAVVQGFNVQEIPVTCRPRIGHSKISGTAKGVLMAGIGILGMIAKLWDYKPKSLGVISRPPT